MTTDFKQFSLSDFTTVAHQSRRRSDGTPLITINGHQRTYGKDDKVVSGSVSINSAFVQELNADFLRFATQGTTLAVVPVTSDASNAYRIRNKNHVAAARTLSLNTAFIQNIKRLAEDAWSVQFCASVTSDDDVWINDADKDRIVAAMTEAKHE